MLLLPIDIARAEDIYSLVQQLQDLGAIQVKVTNSKKIITTSSEILAKEFVFACDGNTYLKSHLAASSEEELKASSIYFNQVTEKGLQVIDAKTARENMESLQTNEEFADALCSINLKPGKLFGLLSPEILILASRFSVSINVALEQLLWVVCQQMLSSEHTHSKNDPTYFYPEAFIRYIEGYIKYFGVQKEKMLLAQNKIQELLNEMPEVKALKEKEAVITTLIEAHEDTNKARIDALKADQISTNKHVKIAQSTLPTITTEALLFTLLLGGGVLPAIGISMAISVAGSGLLNTYLNYKNSRITEGYNSLKDQSEKTKDILVDFFFLEETVKNLLAQYEVKIATLDADLKAVVATNRSRQPSFFSSLKDRLTFSIWGQSPNYAPDVEPIRIEEVPDDAPVLTEQQIDIGSTSLESDWTDVSESSSEATIVLEETSMQTPGEDLEVVEVSSEPPSLNDKAPSSALTGSTPLRLVSSSPVKTVHPASPDANTNASGINPADSEANDPVIPKGPQGKQPVKNLSTHTEVKSQQVPVKKAAVGLSFLDSLKANKLFQNAQQKTEEFEAKSLRK